jgi:hypothetical protein
MELFMQINQFDNSDPARPSIVAVLDASGNPIELLALERATALDILTFFQSVMARFDLEQLAQREGKTFNHALGPAIGARPIGSISVYPKAEE